MFLADELHVMDYSLLVGVRRGRFIVNPDDGQTSLVPEGAQEAGTTEDGTVPPANPLAAATDGARPRVLAGPRPPRPRVIGGGRRRGARAFVQGGRVVLSAGPLGRIAEDAGSDSEEG